MSREERLEAALKAIVEGPPKNILECEAAAWMHEVALEALNEDHSEKTK